MPRPFPADRGPERQRSPQAGYFLTEPRLTLSSQMPLTTPITSATLQPTRAPKPSFPITPRDQSPQPCYGSDNSPHDLADVAGAEPISGG
jgi:hypothetical protein